MTGTSWQTNTHLCENYLGFPFIDEILIHNTISAMIVSSIWIDHFTSYVLKRQRYYSKGLT